MLATTGRFIGPGGQEAVKTSKGDGSRIIITTATRRAPRSFSSRRSSGPRTAGRSLGLRRNSAARTLLAPVFANRLSEHNGARVARRASDQSKSGRYLASDTTRTFRACR